MQIKKRLALLLLGVAIFFMATHFRIFAADVKDSYLSTNREDFVIDDKILVKYQGSEEEIVVPDGVTEIGREAFIDNKTICSVILPEGVTKISSCAFQGCVKLETVQFPSTLKEFRYNVNRITEYSITFSVL